MDNTEYKENYKSLIIPKWSIRKLESFRKPSLLDLENQSRYYIPLIKKFIPNKNDIQILELGCGWGGVIYTLKKFGFQNINAIDIIPECCNFVQLKLKVNVNCVDVFDFFAKNIKKYDVIIAFDFLEHFNKNKIVSLTKLIFETLNKNGRFIMKAPNGGSPKGIYIRYSGFTHEIAFTPMSINELFKSIGFQEVQCIPEPELSSNPIKILLKRLASRVAGRLFSLDPNFINSSNIIGVGIKSDEK